MNFDRVMKERFSCRLYSGKKADWRDIIVAIDAANSAPLAGNIPTLKFILVSEKETIGKIAEACQQDFIASLGYVVVVCSQEKLLEKAYPELSEKYARQQAGAAIENFLLKITDVGLASCWVGAFAENMVKTLLKIPDEVNVEAILPVGYARTLGTQRKKPNLDSVLYFHEWKNVHSESRTKFMRPWKMPPRRD